MQELKPGQNFSHLFPPVHTCSHLFTTVHTSLTIYPLRAMAASCWIFPLRKLLLFDVRGYLSDFAYFCSPNRELSNGAWLNHEWLCREKNIDPSGRLYYSDHVRSSHNVIFCTFECSYSSVLRHILLKLHILTRLIESFPTLHGLWSCIEVKLSIPLWAHA